MKLWHVGLAVPDLKSAQDAFSKLWGLTWRPVVTRRLQMTDSEGNRLEIACDVTFSLGEPFAVELWQSIPNTPLETPASGWLHHVGYWADDFASEGARLALLGHSPVLTRDGLPVLNLGPGGLMIEPCDLLRDQPYIRDLLPQQSPFAGEPIFPSAAQGPNTDTPVNNNRVTRPTSAAVRT
jgi:hypothetical protein